MRHHNRIATFFRKRTKWGPERIYQETRRIIGAQLQVITYNEFLPLFLSKKTVGFYMQKFSLLVVYKLCLCEFGCQKQILKELTSTKLRVSHSYRTVKLFKMAELIKKAFYVRSVIRRRPYNTNLKRFYYSNTYI